MQASKKWTQEEISTLKRLAEEGEHSYEEMRAFLPNRTASGIQSQMRFQGWVTNHIPRLYYFDENFFDIPNYTNAFFGGFLAADGGLEPTSYMKYTLSWQMHQKDEEFLKIFRKEIKCNAPIEYFEETSKNGNKSPHCRMRINGMDIQKYHLVKFGIIPNKTKRIPPPILQDKELILAYIAGYICGDGSVLYQQNGKSMGIEISSSCYAILEYIFNFVLSLNLPKVFKLPKKISKVSDNLHCITFGGVEAIYLHELLRLCPVPTMKRKFEQERIFQLIKNFKSRRPKAFKENLDSVMLRNGIDYNKFRSDFPNTYESLV